MVILSMVTAINNQTKLGNTRYGNGNGNKQLGNTSCDKTKLGNARYGNTKHGNANKQLNISGDKTKAW